MTAAGHAINVDLAWLELSKLARLGIKEAYIAVIVRIDEHLKPTSFHRNHRLAPGAIFHHDRGSNHTSCRFAATLKRLDIRQSAGRTGACFDNALAESFNAALKNERVHRTQYPTREHARRDIARYIEFR